MNLSERWLYKVLIVAILIGTFFYFGSQQLSDVYDDVAEYKADLMADRFAKSVSHIHQQWSAEGKPSSLKLDYFYEVDETRVGLVNLDEQQSVKIWIQMNKKGWPLAIGKESSELNCAQLWRYFAETRTRQTDMVTIAVEQEGLSCLFSWRTAEMRTKTFRYDSTIGEFKSNSTKTEKIADISN